MSSKAKLDNVTTFFLHTRILMNGLKYSKDENDEMNHDQCEV